MNALLAILAVLLIVAALFGGLLKSAAAVAYQRLKTLRLPRLPHWSGKVTINLWQAGLLTVALALLFWSGAGRGCSVPGLLAIGWPWGAVSTSPIAEPGFRVLIVEESEDRAKLTPGQYEAMFSTDAGSLRKYVESKGGTFRVLDDDGDTSMLEAPWQKLMARPRQSLPWLEAANPPRGKEMALPVDEAAAIAAVKQVGG